MPTSQLLPERLRPRNFEEFVGQTDVVGEGKLLRQLIAQGELPSLVFWGPPGVGKTTLARLVAEAVGARFAPISAVMSGKEELKKALAAAGEALKETGARTVLFIDEIHRWNKAQQDALLPHVEKGTITLIGATTENPSFEIIGALLSRCRVFILRYLTEDELLTVLERALKDSERGLGNYQVEVDTKTLSLLAELAGGDARVALTGLELAVMAKNTPRSPEATTPLVRGENKIPTSKGGRGVLAITADDIKAALQRTHLVFDKNGEEFYNLISALHKSMRGSDANASLYWLARMLEGGCDPLYIARRVLRFASEDIGMANSEAMIQANAAFDAAHKIGYPECSVHLAQAVVYCAKSKKSNLLYRAYTEAAKDATATSHLGVPIHLRNAPTKFMKDIGYGKEYKYNPDYQEPVEQEYLPPELKGTNYLA